MITQLLSLAVLWPVTMQDQLPEPVGTLDAIRHKLLATTSTNRVVGLPDWLIHCSSWTQTWEVAVFGIRGTYPLPSFRYRLTPELVRCHGRVSLMGPNKFLIEAYDRGVATFGITSTGRWAPSRPLGFRYDNQGQWTGYKIEVWRDHDWRSTTPTRATKANIEASFRTAQVEDAAKFGLPWFKIDLGEGNSYWVDTNLHVSGPFGVHFSLDKNFRPTFKLLEKSCRDSGTGTKARLTAISKTRRI